MGFRIFQSSPLWGFPQMKAPLFFHFNRIHPYKPSIFRYPQLWKPPSLISRDWTFAKLMPLVLSYTATENGLGIDEHLLLTIANDCNFP